MRELEFYQRARTAWLAAATADSICASVRHRRAAQFASAASASATAAGAAAASAAAAAAPRPSSQASRRTLAYYRSDLRMATQHRKRRNSWAERGESSLEGVWATFTPKEQLVASAPLFGRICRERTALCTALAAVSDRAHSESTQRAHRARSQITEHRAYTDTRCRTARTQHTQHTAHREHPSTSSNVPACAAHSSSGLSLSPDALNLVALSHTWQRRVTHRRALNHHSVATHRRWSRGRWRTENLSEPAKCRRS